jgi:hypothetical protein
VNIYLDVHFELTADLQRILDDDLTLLQQQIETVRLEQLHNDLKITYERMEKSQSTHKVLTLPFFAGPNAPSGIYFHTYTFYAWYSLDAEIVKPVLDSTIRILKTYGTKILSIEVDRLLQEVHQF